MWTKGDARAELAPLFGKLERLGEEARSTSDKLATRAKELGYPELVSPQAAPPEPERSIAQYGGSLGCGLFALPMTLSYNVRKHMPTMVCVAPVVRVRPRLLVVPAAYADGELLYARVGHLIVGTQTDLSLYTPESWGGQDGHVFAQAMAMSARGPIVDPSILVALSIRMRRDYDDWSATMLCEEVP